jgi:integrase
MTRHSFQQGYVSDPIQTRHGKVFKIRYRVRTVEGKWRHKSETLYDLDGKKAARGILQQRLQKASNQKPEFAELTLENFIETYWKPSVQRKGVKPSTEKGYQSLIDVHIVPTLGKVSLVEIAPMQIEELLRIKTDAGLSVKTVRNMVVLLQGIFSLAEESELISKSPIRRKHKPVAVQEKKPVWTPEQVRKIIAAVPGRFEVLFTAAALTGVRVGELLALQRKHVDFETGTLRVEQSLWEGQIVSVKTRSSVRVIPFGEALAGHLTNHLQGSVHIGPEDFVFCHKSGAPLNPDVLRRDVLYPALDRLGIARPKRSSGFHTFRHSAASILNEETGNLKLTQRFLGHADIRTTANVYTHTSNESERRAAEVIERAILGDSVPQLFPEPGTGTGLAAQAGKGNPSNCNKKGGLFSRLRLRGKDLNLRPLGYEPKL